MDHVRRPRDIDVVEQGIRAALPGHLVRWIDALPEPERARLFGDVDVSIIEGIRGALPLAWVDMVAHMRLCVAVRTVVGNDRYESLWTETAVYFCARPLLQGFLKMAIRLFGVTPQAAVRFMPRAYAMGTLGLGSFSAQMLPDSDRIRAELRGFPADEHDFDNYTLGLRGTIVGAMQSLFPEAGVDIETMSLDPGAGHAVFEYEFRAPPPKSAPP